MKKILFQWFKKCFEEELREEFEAYEGGGYQKAQVETAKVLVSRGMNVADVAEIVGLDMEDLEESL